MQHAFPASLSAELGERGVATLRYQFPYMERGSRRPDPPKLCHAAVRAAVAEAARLVPGTALFAGGKSFGGRMTSQAHAASPLTGVRGIAFIGFPLHPSGKPSGARFEHVPEVKIPLLFLQGSRDALADLSLLEPLVAALGERATLRVFPDADHSFHVPARTGRKDAEVMTELADAIAGWIAGITR
jgi:predicted alpha/beta-hydrolase family hydrolase